MKRALVTEVTGQGGSFLAGFLLAKGYAVHGIIRRTSTFNTDRIDHMNGDGDMTDRTGLRQILERTHPDEVYNLAAQSHVRVSFDQPESSEMFGAAPPPQNETESPRRGETFVTRKITSALGRIKFGLQGKLFLGNLDSRRDWGYASDYVEAMWIMLQHTQPDDYVIATGESHSVRDFLDAAAAHCGLDWRKYVETDSRYLRPSEVDFLCGDATKARLKLGWTPRAGFRESVRIMVERDLELASQERTLQVAGHPALLHGHGAH